MTINSEVRVAGPFLGNDITVDFPFNFKVFGADEVLVVQEKAGVEAVLELSADYTVSLNVDQEAAPGGVVTLLAGPLASGETLTLASALAPLQPVDLTNQGGFYPRVINGSLDRLTILIQQLSERLSRTLVAPISDGSVGFGDLPGVSIRRGAVLAFDEVTGAPRVGPRIAAVGTVAANTAATNTVADNIAVVNTVADNIADVTNFADIYYGPSANDPTTRRDGSPLQQGDLYFNTTIDALRSFNGSAWRGIPNGAITVQNLSGDGIETEFLLDYAPENEAVTSVFISGVYQQKNTYELGGAGGAWLIFNEAPPAGADNIEVVVSALQPSDDKLRQDLANSTDPAKGAGLVGYRGRTVAERLGDSASPQDEGAVGDGVADDLAALDAVAASGKHVHGLADSRYGVSGPWVIPSESSVDMRGAEVVLPAGDMHAVQVGDGATIPVGVRLSNVRASGPNTQPTNDFAVINLYKADGAIVGGVEVVDGYNSLSLEYGTATGTERRTVNSILSGAVLRGAYMGLEAFSSAYCVASDIVATRAGKARGIQHGLRVTGYGANHLGMGYDLRNRGNCYGPMVFNNYANGVSLQSGAFGNLLNYAATDCENGLSMPGAAGLDPDQISRSNNHNFAISGCDDGIDITNPISSVYRGTISDCATYGIFSRPPGAGQSRGNIYDLAITRVPAAATFWDSHSHIRLSIKDVVTGAVIAGSYNIVDIVADNLNYTNVTTNLVLTVSGNNNVVRIVADDVKQIFSEVVISGNNNTVDAMLDITGSDGKIAVSGTGNIIRGRCIVTAASSASNDYAGVTGWTGRGVASITTDASGVASIPIAAAVATMFADVRYVGTDADRQIVVRSTSTTAITVKVLTAAGVAVASTAMSVRYAFECYK